MKLSGERSYRFADIEVKPAQSSLSRGGEEHHLRHKSFQVLLYLIERRERLVTKEELMAEVWEGTFVTDDTLVKCIVELRKALGDDPRNPRFIKTIAKSGYRFIGPVEEISPQTPAADRSNRSSAASVIDEIEEISTQVVEYAEETHIEERPLRQRLGENRLLLLFVALLAVVSAVYFGQRWRAESKLPAEVKLPVAPGKRSLAVMLFENQSGDREFDWLREGLSDMLITDLARSKRLSVLSRQQLHLLLERNGRERTNANGPIGLDEALEIGRRSRAEVVALGGFARLGEKVRISVELYKTENGELLLSKSLVADKADQILTRIDQLSLEVARRLGAAPGEQEPPHALSSMTTSSLDAYRYYSLALEQVQMFEFHQAIAQLEKALALDPQFAMAEARIGYIYGVRMGRGEMAKPHLERALGMADRLSEKDKLFISAWLAGAERDAERAISIYLELIARHPMETEAYQRLNWVLQSQNRNEEAIAVIRQGLSTDPESKDLYNALGSASMRLGQNDDALEAYHRYTQLAPNDPNAWDSLAELHRWLGRFEEAEAAYNRALALNPESGVAVIHLGHLRLHQGRYREAAEQFRRFIQIARDDGGRARGFACLAWVYLIKGDSARAAEAAKEEIRHNPESVWSSVVLALRRGDQAEAMRLSRSLFAPAVYELYKERGLLRILEYQRGLLALRQGRSEEALEYLRAALAHRAVEWNYDSYEDCLARAYLELGRADEAIAEYERILRINPRYPLAEYHLGQAYERKGARAQARAAYERFLQIWKDADSDIPEVMAAKASLNEKR